MLIKKLISRTIEPIETVGESESEMPDISMAICTRLAGLRFSLLTHGETKTSAESMAARGEGVVGAKALLLKVKSKSSKEYHFVVAVLPSFILQEDGTFLPNKFDAKVFKKELDFKSVSFASPEDLTHMTGLQKGELPPFGKTVLPEFIPFDTYLDSSLRALDRIGFNAGSLRHSIVMNVPDFLTISGHLREFKFSSCEA